MADSKTPKAIVHASPEHATFVGRFMAGFSHLLWGIKTSLTRPSLLMLSMAVIAANVLIYAVLLYLGYSYSDDFAHYLVSKAPALFRWEWVETLLRILLLISWAIACVFVAIFVASILTGPLLDMLSERTERILTGDVHPLPFAIWPIIYEGGAALVVMVVSFALGMLAWLLLVWVPVVGQAIPFCVAALFVALSFVQPTAVRHKLTVRERLVMLWENKAVLLGFGAPASVFPFLLVPLLTPALVVGGTRLFLALAATGRTPTSATELQVAQLLGTSGSQASDSKPS